MIMQNVWGLPEVSGVACSTYHTCWSPESIGAPLNEKIRTVLDSRGELLVAGDCVCLGYMGAEGSDSVERPGEVFTVDGSYRTGELAKTVTINKNEALELQGSLRNIIYTSGNQPLAPAPLERKLSTILVVEEVMIVGQGKKFFSALFLLKKQTEWADATDVYLRKRVEDMVNVGLSQPQRIKKFAVLRDRNLKSKCLLKSAISATERKKATDHYATVIDLLYSDTALNEGGIPNLEAVLNPDDAVIKETSEDMTSTAPSSEIGIQSSVASLPDFTSELGKKEMSMSIEMAQKRSNHVSASPSGHNTEGNSRKVSESSSSEEGSSDSSDLISDSETSSTHSGGPTLEVRAPPAPPAGDGSKAGRMQRSNSKASKGSAKS